MKNLLFLLLLLFSFPIIAQQEISMDSIINYASRTYISKPDSAQYYLHKGIRLAEEQKDDYYKSLFLTKLISQKTRIRDYDSAKYYFKKANKFILENKVIKLYGDQHSEIAESYYYMEEMDSALFHFKKAGDLWGAKGDSLGILIAKNNIANVYHVLGNYKEAIVNMLEAAKNVDTTQYNYIKAELYLNISELYKEIDDYEKSKEFAEKSLVISIADNKYPLDIVKAYVSLANLAIHDKEYKKAKNYLDKADVVVEKRSIETERFRVYGARGSLLIAQDKFKEAAKLLEKTIRITDKDKLSNFEVFSMKKNLATCYSKLSQPQKALTLYNNILKTALEDNRLDNVAAIYLGISEASEKTGNYKSAIESHKLYAIYNDSILGKDKQVAIKDAQVKYQTIEKESRLAEARAKLAESKLEVKQKNYIIFGSLGFALVLGLLGYLFYNQQKLKNRQLRKENELKTALAKIEVQNKLQEQRLRISRDLHDNIGSQLTFIISSLDNLKYKLKEGETVDKLSKISGFTTNTIYELRDTIWAMNKNDITFEDLQTRISNFIEQAKITSDSTKFSFKISDKINQTHTFTSIQGMNLYRIIQEAVNNASKYAEAEKIEVSISEENGFFIVEIKDEGKGFDKDKVELGNGLNNIKKRARDLNGSLELISEERKGTSVVVSVPIK